MFKVAICDDDTRYIDIIKKSLGESEIFEKLNIYLYTSGENLIEDIHQNFNLVFLDIQMKGIDGNKTAQILRERKSNAVIIFCTGTQMPTPDSFKVQPFRYILKNHRNNQLCTEMNDIINEMKRQAETSYYDAVFDGKVVRIPIEGIMYITIQKYGSLIYTSSDLQNQGFEKQIKTREHIKEIFVKLSDEGFAYAHNSYLVSLRHVLKVDKMEILLDDNTLLNISRSKKKDFDKKFADYLKTNYNRKRC